MRFFRAADPPPPPVGPGDFYLELAGFTTFRASDCRTGVGVMGVPRTGKSSLIEGALRSFVWNKRPLISVDYEGNLDHRLREVLGGDPRYKVHRVDVTTKGGTRPKLPPLLRSKTDRVRFAKALAPMHGHQNDYFDGATQRVLLAGASDLDYWKGDYHLADLVRLCLFPELLSELGRAVPMIGDPYAETGVSGKSAREVRSTVAVRLFDLAVYAALSMHAAKEVDVTAIVDGAPAAVCLVFSDTHKHVLEKFYSFVLDTVNYRKLSMPGSSYMCCNFDELPSLARLESLVDIVRRGAKTNLSYFYSTHSIEGVYKKYGKEDGEDILSLPSIHVILKMGGKASAQHASDTLGVCEILDNIAPRPYMRPPGENDTYSGGIRDRANVHWDEIRRLPLASWELDRIEGFIDTPDFTRPFRCKFRHLVSTTTPPPVREPAPPEHEELPPFIFADYKRLNFPLELVKKADERRAANIARMDKQDDKD